MECSNVNQIQMYGMAFINLDYCICQYWTIDDGSTSDITGIDSDIIQNVSIRSSIKYSTTVDTKFTDTSKTISCGTCLLDTECPCKPATLGHVSLVAAVAVAVIQKTMAVMMVMVVTDDKKN